MKWLDKFDLFLFDFDGLLVNTEELHHSAYVEMCRRRGFELTWNFDKFCSIAHRDADSLQQAIYEEFPKLLAEEPRWEVLYSEKKQAYEMFLKKGKIELLPGVEGVLRSLATSRKKRCIVTNSFRSQIELIKQALPILQTIPVWITRENYKNPKPAPDAYLKAIDLLADPGDQIIGFEDSLRGIQALVQTQAKAVLVCSPKHPQLKEAICKQVFHYASFEKIPPNAF
ncbi:MAG: HAD family phosphatase [Chlamydiae bacterium]|nr:HAD family phosphatase [Chlamydiota bacterium]